MASPVTPHQSLPPSEEQVVSDPRSAVYITTSLHTRLVLDFHRSDTVADLKKNIMSAHRSLFPTYKDIKTDAVKLNHQGTFYTLCDSMLLRTLLHGMKTDLFLCVDASISEEHLEGPVEGDNEEAVVKAASPFDLRDTYVGETVNGELPKNALDVPEQDVVTDVARISGVQHNGPEWGDNGMDFIIHEANQGVREPLVAGSVGDKSSTRKRKKSAPKQELGRNQVSKEKKHVLQAEGPKLATPPAEPRISTEGADLEKRQLKQDSKEKLELKHVVVIGLKVGTSLDKSKEVVDEAMIAVNSQETSSKKETIAAVQDTNKKGKRKHGLMRSTEQVGDTNASTETTKGKTRKFTSLSAVPSSDNQVYSHPVSRVPDVKQKEDETQSAAYIFGKESDLADMSENIGLIPMEVAKGNVRSGKEKIESSSRKEGRKVKRSSTSDQLSVPVENSSKPLAKAGRMKKQRKPRDVRAR